MCVFALNKVEDDLCDTMTLSENHEAVLIASRERLARASAHLERLTRDAAETILHQRQEKEQLERRLAEMGKLVEQERSNFEQRAALLTSVTSETEQRAKAFDELSARLNDQERLLSEQLETIATLESELSDRAMQLREQQGIEQAWRREIDEWKSKVEALESRLEETARDRDSLKGQFYEREREDAQYSVRWTADQRDHASKMLDSLMEELTVLETRITLSQP